MDKVEEHEDVSGDVHDGGDVDEAVGQHGTADGSDHRQPWGRLPPQSPDEERQLVHRRAKIGRGSLPTWEFRGPSGRITAPSTPTRRSWRTVTVSKSAAS